MPKQLPANRTVAEIASLAEALLAGHQAQEPASAERIRANHPRFADVADATLFEVAFTATDAELAIAREYGFASWRQLAVYLSHPAGLEHFLQLSCINYFTTDRPANYERAGAMLAADGSLASRDIWHAACVGDVQAVRGFLDADATLVDQRGGYFDWQPLLYACYSRLNLADKSTLDVARLLLERGADPNAHYMWGGQYRFTALTGAFGEGEMGPVNQPPHEHWQALAKLLLEAGANPNDGQALYNTMFTPSNDCLRMLLDAGLTRQHRNNWLYEEDGELGDNPSQTLGYQLEWAARNHHVERARLLVEHGAEVQRHVEGRSLYEWAWLTGHPDLAQYFVDHGAEAVELSAAEHFAGLCMSADAEAVQSALAEQPDLVARTSEALPNLLVDAAAANRIEALRTMLGVGFDPNQPSVTALHQASFHGQLDAAKLLVEGGADFGAREERFAATPMQWAVTAGQTEVAAYLASLEIGIFDAALCEDAERINTLLKADPTLLEATVGSERAKRNPEPHSEDWQTPLAFAATRNKVASVRLLLELGARLDVVDQEGRGILEIVRPSARDELVGLLESALQ